MKEMGSMRFHTILAAAVAPLALGGVLLTATAASAAPKAVTAGRAESANAPGPSLPAASARFRTVDVPGAAGGTMVNSVNSWGTVLGTWFDSKGASYGFIEQPGGRPVTFNYPGTKGVTSPGCINDLGTAVGWWYDSANNVAHGWIRSPGDHFTQIDDPSAVLGTNPTGVSDTGLIVGTWVDASSNLHGFIDDHGTFRTLDYPGATDTGLNGVTFSGAILGAWGDASGAVHGFVYQHGRFTTFNAPGAGTGQNQGTFPEGISSTGTIGGYTTHADNAASGWVLRNGHFSSLNDPHAAPGQSWVTGISSSAHYASGSYNDTNGVGHGFIATLSP
jgi:hypothetical protein